VFGVGIIWFYDVCLVCGSLVVGVLQVFWEFAVFGDLRVFLGV